MNEVSSDAQSGLLFGKVALVIGASRGIGAATAKVTAKAGIIALTKVAALDYADRGVRVNVLAPGPILTHHLEVAGEQARRHAALGAPMRRVGTTAEIAEAVLWLASDQSSFITGITLPIDGGQSAGAKPQRMFRTAKPNHPEMRS